MNVPNKTKGFTIIEVVLVLAIAGLIFLVVFLALPALQRGQRDSQRKTDLGKLMSQVTAYQSNNQGALPADATAWGNFLTNYVRAGGSTFADPSSGTNYTVTLATAATTPAPSSASDGGAIIIYRGLTCASGGVSSGSIDTASRKFAAVIYQEQGGFYCQNN